MRTGYLVKNVPKWVNITVASVVKLVIFESSDVQTVML